MTQTAERMLPLHERKMGLLFDHRYASFRGLGATDIEQNQESQVSVPDIPACPEALCRRA